MVCCVSAMGRILFITLVGDLNNGSYLEPSQDLFLGVVFYLSELFTYIHIFRPDPFIKV